MIRGHQIEEFIKVEDFLALVKTFSEKHIITTRHTFFRLSQKQRKVFKEERIKEFILARIPKAVGIQYNSNYAAFYTYEKNDLLKLILDIQPDKINVITFYIINSNQIPRLK